MRLTSRRGPGSPYRALQTARFLLRRDRRDVAAFLAPDRLGPLTRWQRLTLVARFLRITQAVRGYHTLGEMLTAATEILRRSGRADLTVVEAGCGYGSSTAKLSLATRAASGRLLAFDTFRGMPANDERHTLLDGRATSFRSGAFRGNLAAIRRVLERYGAPEVTTLIKGPVAETLPALDRVDVAVLDVDLLASTRACLVELVPRLAPGGVILSLDGQLRATHALLGDPDFWHDEVGVPPPSIEGLGTAKLLRVTC